MPDSPDDRSALARGIALAATVTAISAQMAVPAVIGYWLDQRLGVAPLLTLAGAALGLYAGVRSLMYLVRPKSENHGQGNDADRATKA